MHLKEMAADSREGLQDQITAISLAKEKGLPLVSGYGTVVERGALTCPDQIAFGHRAQDPSGPEA